MEARFEKGQKVKVTANNGKSIEGTVKDWDYNYCTFEKEYAIDYLKDSKVWTMIGVPEKNITLILP